MANSNVRFTLRQLQFFVAAAQSGKLSQAAVDCHVTQSAMTSAISELEKTLGCLLFERSRNGVSLTYDGNLFFQKANALLEMAYDASRDPFQSDSKVSGTLEIAASYTVLGYFILPLIARFQKKFPRIKITPKELSRSDIELAIKTDELEIAVAILSNVSDPEAFDRQSLVTSRRQLWVAYDHPLADLPQVALQDVAAFPYIFPHVDEGQMASMTYWGQSDLQPEKTIRTTSMEAVREMVGLGLGVTILSDMVFRPWSLEGRRIRRIPLLNKIPPMEIGLIWKKDHTLSPVAQVFRDYLEVVSSSPSNDA